MTRHYLPISIIVALIVAAMIYWRLREPVDRLVRLGGAVAAAVVPRMLAITTFLAGTILLFSGATPPIGHRLYWVNHFLPLPVASGPWSFSTIHAATDIAPNVRIALIRGVRDQFRRHDSAFMAAGGSRLRYYSIPFATHSLKKLLIAGPIIEHAVEFLVEPRRTERVQTASSVARSHSSS